MPAQRHSKRRAILLASLAILLIGGVVAIMTALVGRVSGREFAPTHFTMRSFVFWEIPLIHLQVSTIERTPETMPITNYLRSQNMINVPNGKPTAWPLVEISRGLGETTPADPEILVNYLLLGDGTGTLVWESWSKDHPKAAAVFWPVVQRLAETDLYILLPELFAIAQRQTDPAALSAEIDAHLRTAYVALAKDLIAARRPALAASVIHDALADFPNHPELQSLLGTLPESLRAPPEPEAEAEEAGENAAEP